MSLIRADARAIPLVDSCVQCVVTSPPYWGLRDYGNSGQIGLESTPDAYVQTMVQVFAEVWRVLKDDGTCWLNLGSSYASDPAKGGSGTFNGRNWRGESYGRPAIRSHQQRRAPACGSDGTGLQDSTAFDFACSGLCDGCLSDFLSHRAGIAGTGLSDEQYVPLPSQISRDTEPSDCEPLSRYASLHDVQVSTTLQSWRQHRAACSRCDNRASALSLVRSSSGDALASAGMSWLNYTSRLKQKDLVPVPWMVAMALQSQGWYLRSDIVWSKPNPMPESVTDRPTKAHEYIFLLAKQERYYYDSAAINEASVIGAGAKRNIAPAIKGAASTRQDGDRFGVVNDGTRNKRSVWHVATQPYSGSHFATFPEALIEPCILAGSRPGDLVFDPFIGSGTVGTVCDRLMRRWVGTDLSYQHLAKKRTAQRGLRLEWPA